MRRAARTDDNHAAVMRCLRKAGAEVTDLSKVGQGCPDLLVSHAGKWYLVEVKDGQKAPSQRKLTPAQHEWHKKQMAHVCVVENEHDALKALGLIPIDWREVLGDRR